MQHKKIHRLGIVALAVSAALGLSACNDTANDTSTSTTSATTSGVITGFGSVFVNGVEYETGNAEVLVEGTPLDESALKVGMVVTLEGTVNPDGSTGQALSIRYADEVDGEVLANNVATDNTLTIMGMTVHVDTDTVFDSFDPNQLSPADIQPGNLVEVSGFSSGDGNIYATRIEVKKAQRDPGEEMELKGVIANLDTANQTFTIGPQTIDYSGANLDLGDLADLADGLFVEVKSTTGFDADGVLVASKVELEGDGKREIEAPEGKELEIEGVITAVIDPQNGIVEVNGQRVQLSASTEGEGLDLNNLAAGMKVKVEGKVNADGILVAEEAKAKPKAELEIAAQVEGVDVNAGTLTLLGQTIRVTAETIKRDESDHGERYFDLADIATGDWVKVKLAQDADGTLVAVALERDDNDEGKPARIEGKIDATATGSVTLGPLDIDLSGLTNAPSPMAGDEVEIEVSVNPDGSLMATRMELDD